MSYVLQKGMRKGDGFDTAVTALNLARVQLYFSHKRFHATHLLSANWEELSASRRVAFYPEETWEANSLAATIEPQLKSRDNGLVSIVHLA